ncbi:MAG: GNAT family N-acetyltransferase [Chloroflexota bacterium]
MDINIDEVQVVHNPEKKRFEVQIGDQIAVMEYMLAGSSIVFSHTEVPEAFGGKGIASKMARTALAFAKEEGKKVLPICPYVAAFIGRHPEYRSQVFGVDKHIDQSTNG